MGLGLDEHTKSIRNTWGRSDVDAALTKNGQVLSLGFKFTKSASGAEAIELVGDFYSTGVNESTFMDNLSQIYQKHNIIEKCEDQGWIVDDVLTDKEGLIHVQAHQLA
jgi:hypothetical protein